MQTDVFHGIESSMPARENGVQLAVRLPAEKAAKWPDSIKTFLTADAIEKPRGWAS